MSVEQSRSDSREGLEGSAPVEADERASDEDVTRDTTLGAPLRWKVNLLLFLATVVSVFFAGAFYELGYEDRLPKVAGLLPLLQGVGRALPSGWSFAVPLLLILLTHEFGHFIAARIHRVEASLPFFIPLPLVSPFGTMGAVISMPERIRSRSALLDIGASGPLAGLVVALPTLILGLCRSEVKLMDEHGYQEGQSLLYLLLKRVIFGPIPAGHDVILNATAFAGWTGLFITALNLLPVAQLDGGHVAYALFGPRQDRYSRILHASLLGVFALNLLRFLVPVLSHPGWTWHALEQGVENSLPWLVWYVVLGFIRRIGGRDHPPTEPGELGPIRKVVAWLTLALFVLLFMPTPWSHY